MGKYALWATIGFLVVIIGMLFYPTVHTNWSGIDVTSFTDLEKAGMVILSYGFIFFIVYLVLEHVKR